MTTRNNAKLVAGITAEAAGALYLDRQVVDLSDRSWIPINLASGDNIQIGIIPAGHILVPQLSQIQVPEIDTNGSPTVKYKIGSVATVAALAAEKTPGAAASVVKPSDFIVGGTGWGSPDTDTPIYLNLSAAIATQAATGLIVSDWVFRAWNPQTDA